MKSQDNFSPKQRISYMLKLLTKNSITVQQWWEFIANVEDKDILRSVIEQMRDIEDRIRDFKNGYYFRMKIRKFCNQYGYSDVEPFEVVRVVSPTIIEIREMDSKLVKAPEKYFIGGFSAHCADNHAQEWECTPNEKNTIRRIHLGKKGWGNGQFRMDDEPIKFYDYNF